LVAEHKLGSAATSERKERFERIGETPFTSQRKMMSVLVVDHAEGDAHVLITKGAPDVLLAHCTHARRGEATVALDAALHKQVLADVSAMTDDALRTWAVARRTLASDAQIPADAQKAATLEQDLEYLGTVGIIDPPRKEAALAIEEARQAGIRVVMTTRARRCALQTIWASSTAVRRCSRASSSTSWTKPPSPPQCKRHQFSPAWHPSTSWVSCKRCRPAATWWP
jgi:Ca2+-transporting ATPase